MRKKANNKSAVGQFDRDSHTKIEILIFGGSKFREREPNDDEYSDMCLSLTIDPVADKYELKYLPGAKLRIPDKFFGNMQTRIDVN